MPPVAIKAVPASHANAAKAPPDRNDGPGKLQVKAPPLQVKAPPDRNDGPGKAKGSSASSSSSSEAQSSQLSRRTQVRHDGPPANDGPPAKAETRTVRIQETIPEDAQIVPFNTIPQALDEQSYTADNFRQHRELMRRAGGWHNNRHNFALKYLRDRILGPQYFDQFGEPAAAEHDGGHFELEIGLEEKWQYPDVVHPHAGHRELGSEYTFDEMRSFMWCPMDLIASLRDMDIARLVGGNILPDETCTAGPAMEALNAVRNDGRLVKCVVAYDCSAGDIGTLRKERALAKDQRRPPKFHKMPAVVDFIFTRADGVMFSLHPEYNKKKVPVRAPYGEQAPEIKSGLYKSDGPGTFRGLHSWNTVDDVQYHFKSTESWPASRTRAAAGSAAATNAPSKNKIS